MTGIIWLFTLLRILHTYVIWYSDTYEGSLSILILKGTPNLRLSHLLSHTAGIHIWAFWALVLFSLGAGLYSLFPYNLFEKKGVHTNW